MALPQLALFDEFKEPFLYHDPSRPGYTSLVTPGGARHQHSFKLSELEGELLKCLASGGDAYIAQNEFTKPNRRAINCWRLTSLYIDLDTYKVEGLQHRSAEALTDQLISRCVDAGIPPPSVVVSSGRGLQAKWLLATPLPGRAIPRWQLVQAELASMLDELGADHGALDASRVLRLVGSTNSKSGELVRTVHLQRTPTMGGQVNAAGVVMYDFDILADTLLPLTREELARRRAELAPEIEHRKSKEREQAKAVQRSRLTLVPGGRAAGRLTTFIPSQLAWDRLSDLRALVKLRGWDAGVPSGYRDEFMFLGACFLADAKVAPELRAETLALCREFAPTWSESELRSRMSTVFARADAAARGELIQWDDKLVDPRYRFRNDTLIERLQITSDEMKHLATIIDSDECRRRDRERKRQSRENAGAMKRSEYLAQANEKKLQAQALKEQGLSFRQIAARLGVGVASVSRYCS